MSEVSASLPPASDQEQSERGTRLDAMRIVLLALALSAFALRIFMLDAQSIWWDEGISLHLAGSDLAEIFSDRLDNIHPPLYFIVLKGWLALTGVTVFSARYLSVLAGWLQVAATYAVATRWFGRRTGLVAAFLAAISAVSLIYAQEIRVYSILPLAYLALLAITRELTHSSPATTGEKWIAWLALGVVSWIAIHLHYVSLFAVGYVTVWALISFSRAHRWPDLWRVLIVQLLVAVASLPWFLAAAANWIAISGEANAGTFITDPVSLRFLIAQIWTFHLTGLAGALSRPGIEFVAGFTALLLALLVFIRLCERQTRHSTAVLLGHWLIPLSSALLVWLVRSFSHPRYVAMFVPGLILLASYVILPGVSIAKASLFSAATRAIALFLLVLLAGLSFWGLNLYFFDEDVARDDIRGAARYLEQVTSAGDLILVPDTDYSLPFEYQGDARIAMPDLENEIDNWNNLVELTSGVPRVYVLDYERGTRDWQGVLPFALHKAGERSSFVDLDDLVLTIYKLDQPISPPEFAPASERFGPLELSGVWTEQDATVGDAISVAFQWRMGASEAKPRVNVALRLLDENGRVISAGDDRLLDHQGKPSDQWPTAETVTTYHLLPVPSATPPLDYTVAVQVYDQDSGQPRAIDLLDEQGAPKGQSYFIRGVQAARRERPLEQVEAALSDSLLAEHVELFPGLVLQDVGISQQSVAPGTPLKVELLWLATEKLPDLRPRLEIIQNTAILAAINSAPSGGRYPTSLWNGGEQVLEERTLMLPAGSAGEAQLVLKLGEYMLILGNIVIERQDHVFDLPQIDNNLDARFDNIARLVGFDLPEGPYSTTETVPLTLLWESLSEASTGDYVVFAHLLSEDGRLIGQHDGIPGQGERPVSGWVPGEYILDPHKLAFRDTTYDGTAIIEVGIYDPVSGERVKLQDNSDRILLPVKLSIDAPE